MCPKTDLFGNIIALLLVRSRRSEKQRRGPLSGGPLSGAAAHRFRLDTRICAATIRFVRPPLTRSTSFRLCGQDGFETYSLSAKKGCQLHAGKEECAIATRKMADQKHRDRCVTARKVSDGYHHFLISDTLILMSLPECPSDPLRRPHSFLLNLNFRRLVVPFLRH